VPSLPVPTADPEQVRRVADRVLARQEYAGAREGLVSRVLDLIAEGLGRLLDSVGTVTEDSVGGTVIVVVAVAVLAVVLFLAARTVRRDPSADSALLVTPGRAPGDWEQEATAAEAEARWRDALRARYRLGIARLAAGGLVEEVPGKTTGEYLIEASANVPGAATDLRDVTEAFDAAWYGDRAVDAADVRAVRDGVERVTAALRARV